MRLKRCHNFRDFRELARRRLPGPIFESLPVAVRSGDYPFGLRSITRFALPCERSTLPGSTTFTSLETPM